MMIVRPFVRRVAAFAAVAILLASALPAHAADPPAAVLSADTPLKTASGAQFTAPKSWTVAGGGQMTVLTAPEGDVHVAVVDVTGAATGHDAAAKAWLAYQPSFKRPVLRANDLPARDGWDAITVVGYETSPAEHVAVQAYALHKGTTWTVLLLEGNAATFEKRGAQVGLIAESVRPGGYVRETFAGRTAHRLTPERIAALKSFITTAMEQLHVPGTAIALIDHGKVVFEGGFGVRNVSTAQPVDANTLFMVASNTKGLSTLLLAELVDQGKLRWDEPVVDVFPSFRLGDEATTKSVLVKHLVCACTGLPRKDFEWIFTTTPQTPVTKTFDFLAATAPTSKFGEVFQYNNLMATAAGYIGGHVAYPSMELGAAYDRAMQSMVFDPLGMRSTTFDTAKARAGDHADPYGIDVDGKTAPDNVAIDDAIAPYRPAGGAWSSVHDMTRYVENELTRGVLPNGRRLVSEKSLLQRRERTVAIGESGWYGMGLMSDATYGVTIVHHGGDLAGYHSDWYAFPDAQVGAVFLTNADQGVGIRDPFMRRILEVLYDGKPEAAEDVATGAKLLFESVAVRRARITVPAASDAAAQLATSYTNPDLGPITVVRDAGGLTFRFTAFSSRIATRKNEDGTTSFITIDPGNQGFAFVLGNGARTLTLRDGQHTYVFTPS
ncbi:MAG TPA: serine hydrolase domain-containing protein [Candidatus Elarobacter sp.]